MNRKFILSQGLGIYPLFTEIDCSSGSGEWLYGLSCIQIEERERVMKFHFKKDAKSSLVGRLLLRKALLELCGNGISNSHINLGRTERGKPFLIGSDENLYFNISHHGDYVVLAAERGFNVGIDIMKTEIKGNQTLTEFFDTMRNQFTPQEWQTIQNSSSGHKKLEMFMRFWCLKESYVKALGVGLGLLKKLQGIEFRIDPLCAQLNTKKVATATKLYLNNTICDEWCFEETKLDENHQVVVALQSPQKTSGENLDKTLFQILSMDDVLTSISSLSAVDEMFWAKYLEMI